MQPNPLPLLTGTKQLVVKHAHWVSTITLNVETSDTINSVMVQIRGRKGIPTGVQRITTVLGVQLAIDDELGDIMDALTPTVVLLVKGDGGAKRVVKDDRMAVSRAKVEVLMRAIFIPATNPNGLVEACSKLTEEIMNNCTPLAITDIIGEMSAERANAISEKANFASNDLDKNIIRIAGLIFPEIQRVDEQIRSYESIKNTLTKALAYQYTAEFYDESTNQFSHGSFLDLVDQRAKYLETKDIEDKVKAAFEAEQIKRDKALRDQIESEFAIRYANAANVNQDVDM